MPNNDQNSNPQTPMRSNRVQRSLDLFDKAKRLIPGGTQLISRRPSQFAYGVSPIYAVRAEGPHFWDVDGNQYIDWASGIGSIILGYADPIVDQAVHDQIRAGTVYSINHELEIELAEELVATVPCAEMVRYAKGGGDACAVAVRIARGATGHDKILFCGYHGWHDWYLAANLGAANALNQHLLPGVEPIGVPKCLEGTAIPFPYGDLGALEEALDRHRGQIAAIMMEPLRGDLPPDGYLAAVRALADAFGVLLIFDEVTTGFRPTASGVQTLLGVTPDMAVFAKSISNGYPMGAVVGSRSVMEPASQMFISSTYWSDTIGLRAALTTLREIRRRNVPAHLSAIGTKLQVQLNKSARIAGVPVTCGGVNFFPSLRFDVDDAELKQKLITLFIQEMARRGCHGNTSFYLNAAQGNDEVEQTCTAAGETFVILAEALANRSVDRLLECDPTQESFRRLVR